VTPVTRRQLLAGITAAGAAGTLSGVGTAALLVDRETLAASVESGRVELRVDAGSGSIDAVGGPVELPVPALEAGDSGSIEFAFTVPGEAGVNPAYLWLRVGCGAASGLGDQLSVTLSRRDGLAGTLYDGDLAGLIDVVGGGVPLDPSGAAVSAGEQDCFEPGTTAALELAYELSPSYVGSETTSILLEGAAVQCRRVDPSERPPAFGVPLGVADCAAEAPCDCCQLVGKYETVGDSLAPGVYDFTEGTEEYRLSVTDVQTNGGGEPTAARFRVVLADDPTAEVDHCLVLVKSGKGPQSSTDVFSYEGDAAQGVVGTDGQSISHVVVGTCAARVDGECPPDLVPDSREQGGKGPNGVRGRPGDGTKGDTTNGKGGGE
jgi:hypothetical protein